jgi:radical SAM superfamily enzyme
MIRENTDFLIGVHLIIGLPGETDEMVYETFCEINRINPDYVKIHHLQVVKGTELERIYTEGKYTPLTADKYIELFSNAVSYLDRSIVIQRIISRAHSDQLIAPKWGFINEEFKFRLFEYMDKHGIYQSKNVIS